LRVPESSEVSSVSHHSLSGILFRSLGWCLPGPAHTSNEIFLANDLYSESKRIGNCVFYPVILIPDSEPMLRNGLSDSRVRKLVGRIRKVEYEL